MICKHDGLSNHKLGYAKLNVQNAALREYYKEPYIVFFHFNPRNFLNFGNISYINVQRKWIKIRLTIFDTWLPKEREDQI